MHFGWNEAKRRQNLRKHGLDFADCTVVFESDNVFISEDAGAHGEQRFLALGLLRQHVIVVAHTESNDTIRLISARKANKHEQRKYFEKIRNRLGSFERNDGRRH